MPINNDVFFYSVEIACITLGLISKLWNPQSLSDYRHMSNLLKFIHIQSVSKTFISFYFSYAFVADWCSISQR